jgi:hypothetical protein
MQQQRRDNGYSWHARRDTDVRAAVAAAVLESELDSLWQQWHQQHHHVQLGAAAHTCVCQVQLQAAMQDYGLCCRSSTQRLSSHVSSRALHFVQQSMQQSKLAAAEFAEPVLAGLSAVWFPCIRLSMQAWWLNVHSQAKLLCCQRLEGISAA